MHVYDSAPQDYLGSWEGVKWVGEGGGRCGNNVQIKYAYNACIRIDK